MFNSVLKPVLAAGIALAAVAAPAHAQVNGIAVAEAPVAIASSQALQTAFQQIGTTYTTQITQIEQLDQQRQQLIQTLDTNGDGQLDEAEQASLNESNPTVQQIAGLEQQINEARGPIDLARIYAMTQVAQQYTAAAQQVISAQNIQFVLSPESIVYAADGANINQAITDALNARVPSVTITPPQGWQPNQSAVTLYQQVQQVFAIARAQQQQAAAQQQAAQPAAAAPAGEVPPR